MQQAGSTYILGFVLPIHSLGMFKKAEIKAYLVMQWGHTANTSKDGHKTHSKAGKDFILMCIFAFQSNSLCYF